MDVSIEMTMGNKEGPKYSDRSQESKVGFTK